MELIMVHPAAASDPRAESMLPAVGGFPPSDRPLFLAGYSELCRENLNGGRALEICGGFGKLAAGLAEQFPQAEVTGLDLYEASGPDIEEKRRQLPGLSYVAGDAFDLSRYEDGFFDLVFGQAALHHLSHDLDGISREVLRVLKPGGRNLVVAAVRAVNMARFELGDESNLYLSQFERMLHCGFSTCEVQMFNLLGYPMKALSDRFAALTTLIRRIDAWLFLRYPKLLRYGANCNVVFTK
jgi:SAM-dependent methyltransferase